VTPVNAAWNSKLGVGFSGVGYAKHSKSDRHVQKDVTADIRKKRRVKFTSIKSMHSFLIN
jgi:hypothetical protein